VLNHDDAQCRRIGEAREIRSCVWFSAAADSEALAALSKNAAGAIGLRRTKKGTPAALTVWIGGAAERELALGRGLDGAVIEPLLAAVAAARFGPVPVDNFETALRGPAVAAE
jgi:hypothetical protein